MRSSFVRSLTMDTWTEPQLRVMEAGGNARAREFLQHHDVTPRPDIATWRSEAAELWRLTLAARRDGLPEPTALSDEDRARVARYMHVSVPSAPPEWTPDSKAAVCERCGTGFTCMRRRHHCRRCGRCVCAGCAPRSNTRPILEWNLRQPVRHCLTCYQSPTGRPASAHASS